MASSAPHERERELAHRASDGIEIVLFWHELSNDLTVCVSDQRTGAYFELAAEPEHALEVFEHPYAYAAFKGLCYEEALLASRVETAETPAPVAGDQSHRPTR
jgi:hypothetical protein